MGLIDLAPEIVIHIFSFLPTTELYRIRGVCKTWQRMAEDFIYLTVKSKRQHVTVKVGKDRSFAAVEMEAQSFDVDNRVIEFRPIGSPLVTLPSTDSSSWPWCPYQRRMQIHFKPWLETTHTVQLSATSLQDQALIMFHMQYNPALERIYELPSSYDYATSCHHHHDNRVEGQQEEQQRFVGDKGLILSFSYVNNNKHSSCNIHKPRQHFAYNTLPAPQPPLVRINWLRVTLAWLLSGMHPAIAPTQIYPQRYTHLSHALARHGVFKYDPLSEPVLSHIVAAHRHFPTAEKDDDVVPHELLEYVQTHTHECHTRLSRLQHMLEGAGVDARVLWKYSFAKSYVVGNGSLLGEEDVVRRIQDSEEEWRRKRASLVRRLKPH